MSIALLYERSENDENGIKLTAQQLGIDLIFLPFRKIALSIGKDGFNAKTKGKNYTNIINDVAVVLESCTKQKPTPPSIIHYGATWQKNNKLLGRANLYATANFALCLNLWKEGIPIPKTVFVPCDSSDTLKNGQVIHNEKDIAELFQQEIPLEDGIVIKG